MYYPYSKELYTTWKMLIKNQDLGKKLLLEKLLDSD